LIDPFHDWRPTGSDWLTLLSVDPADRRNIPEAEKGRGLANLAASFGPNVGDGDVRRITHEGAEWIEG
jgi:hypothetical protein